MELVRKQEGENVLTKILELFAMARTLICMARPRQAGIDQGLKDAQYVFEAAFKYVAPILKPCSANSSLDEFPAFRIECCS
jgi:hypothetical protein